jgi:hypothetical protein
MLVRAEARRRGGEAELAGRSSSLAHALSLAAFAACPSPLQGEGYVRLCASAPLREPNPLSAFVSLRTPPLFPLPSLAFVAALL